jgi:hypothetical protein
LSIFIPAVPALPITKPEFSALYLNQLNNVLRLYFNLLNNAVVELNSAILDLETDGGGSALNFPYGAFSSDVSQSTTVNTTTLLTLNTTDFSNNVSIVSSQMTVVKAGIYNLQFSVQVQNLDNASQDVYIWLRQNGVDIVGSTGVIGMPARKSVGDPSHDIKGWNYFLSMNAGDYVEIWWSTTDIDVTIPAYVASGSPTKPSTQSVVATMSFVSALTV